MVFVKNFHSIFYDIIFFKTLFFKKLKIKIKLKKPKNEDSISLKVTHISKYKGYLELLLTFIFNNKRDRSNYQI